LKQWLWGLAVGLIGLAGCSTIKINGVTPTYPEMCPPYLCTVDRLTPLFRWEPAPGPDPRYDFIIYEAHEIECLFPSDPYRCEWAIGRKVDYRQGLQEPEHTLEVPLQPNREYYWSVRVRHGENVSAWSHFEFFQVFGLRNTHNSEFPFFLFKTPAEKQE